MAAVVLLAAASGIRGQISGGQPSFEVASVKPAPPPDGTPQTRIDVHGGPGTDDPGRFTAQSFDLTRLVMKAYGIDRDRLSAPGWMDTTRFNIAATIPPGTTPERFKQMLQNLLADRFKLAVHFDKKEMQIYELTVAKNGPKMKPSVDDPAVEPAMPDRPRLFTNKMQAGKVTMEEFAHSLSIAVRQTVVDATGLKGRYDAGLFWVGTAAVAGRGRDGGLPSPDGNAPPQVADPARGPDIFDALRTQLGLELKQKKGPVDIVVIDHAEKVPTEN